ncbi:hypothetical protein OGAPHI_000913 [Ogataea philodendri]|uniref:Phosducin domain-containing protein n=1 Tax=Ogataea philodendri TaxID=1378263 RepID=A0A9P8T8L5_9ASCO|nr:uncharacterized protein OGAPHI_000913 [Ogataea philodendri]KAH3670398.1 hypothetical protein OGAPHI_000913 [Ogataea philodendri]
MSDSESLRELEDEMDDYLVQYREQRMEELAKEVRHAKNAQDAYQEITDEGELMRKTTGTRNVVIFFHNPEFQTCKLVDQALRELASKYYDTHFYKIEALNAPFLAVKLQIKVLPCVLTYKDGVETGRVVGLQGLIQGTDLASFKTQSLENLLLRRGVLKHRVSDMKY